MRIKHCVLAASLLAVPAFSDHVPCKIGEEALIGHRVAVEGLHGKVLIVQNWDGLAEYERKRDQT